MNRRSAFHYSRAGGQPRGSFAAPEVSSLSYRRVYRQGGATDNDLVVHERHEP